MKLLSAEWLKIRTVISTKVLLIIAFGLTLVVGCLVAANVGIDPLGDFDPLVLSLTGGSIAVTLLGVVSVLCMAGEYRSQSIRATLAAVPQRSRLFAAKAVLVVLLNVGFAALALGLTTGLAWVILIARGQAPEFGNEHIATLGGGLILFALHGLVGLAIATLIRNAAAAICLLVLWPLLFEGLASVMLGLVKVPELSKFLPFSAGAQLFLQNQGAEDVMSRWSGGLYFAGFAAVLCAAALWLFNRRDA